MSDEHIQHVSDIEEYRKLTNTGTCVVKFTAVWCGPCKVLAPTFKKLTHDYIGKITAIEVDIDANGADEISDFENVQAVPYVLFYRGGHIVTEHVGGGSDAFKEVFLKFANDEVAELQTAIHELENTVTDIQNIIEAKVAEVQVTADAQAIVDVLAISALAVFTGAAVQAVAETPAVAEAKVAEAPGVTDSDSDLEDIIGDDEDDVADNKVLTIAGPALDMSKLAQNHDEDTSSYEESLTDEDVDVLPGDEAGTDMIDDEIAAQVVSTTT